MHWLSDLLFIHSVNICSADDLLWKKDSEEPRLLVGGRERTTSESTREWRRDFKDSTQPLGKKLDEINW